MLLLKLFIFAITALATAHQAKEPRVRILHGVLKGTWKNSTEGRTYGSFEGIPYARPPLGKFRFREPQPPAPWPGVWHASQPLLPCLQRDAFHKKVVGREDCLHINVYSPKSYIGAMLPVVVFIHGGTFMHGSGSFYDPVHLMDKDLVVVTFNYRLGPLGFLSTGDEVVPGNAGLKDQTMALRWVRNNILMFGGNPDSVTLAGCSAGGASVHYHYLSPMSRGLFSRGIAFSGSAFTKWAHQHNPAEKAKALAAAVGCPAENNKDMVYCMENRNADMLVAAQADLIEWKVHMFTPFTPTIEAPHVKEPFLTRHPYHAAQAGSMYKAPLIVSVTSEEGLYPAAAYQTDTTLLEELEDRWEHLSSYMFEYIDTLPLEHRSVVARKIKQKYLTGKPVGQETFPQLVQALGDRLFVVDAGKMAQVHAMKSGQPVYVCRYSYRGNFSFSDRSSFDKDNYGVGHGDDVLHIFKYQGLTANSTQDKQMTEALLAIIYSFACTGRPKLGDDGEWLAIAPGSSEISYLEILSPNNTSMKTSSDFGQRSFWDNLDLIENEKYPDHIRDEL